MKKFFIGLKDFLRNTANDERIPDHDRKILLALIVLILSPIDLIPDWIPFLGLLDDFFILAIVLEYFFSVLDQDILLSHYPWSMKSFLRLKRVALLISAFIPSFIKKILWKYTKGPY